MPLRSRTPVPPLGHLRVRDARMASAHIAPPASAKGRWGWLANAAAVLALVSLVTSLFGYGVLMGFGAVFHVDHNLFVSSPLDLLLAAWAGVASNLLGLGSFSALLDLYRQSGWMMLVGFLALAVTIAWMWWWAPDTTIASAFKGWLAPKVRRARAQPRGESRFIAKILAPVLAITLALAPAAIWLATSAVLTAVVAVPLMGYSAAQTYAKRFVLPASQCATASNLNAPNVKTLHCSTIAPSEKSGEGPKTGYIVIATSAYALLYDPVTRLAERVPTQNAVIRSTSPATAPR